MICGGMRLQLLVSCFRSMLGQCIRAAASFHAFESEQPCATSPCCPCNRTCKPVLRQQAFPSVIMPAVTLVTSEGGYRLQQHLASMRATSSISFSFSWPLCWFKVVRSYIICLGHQRVLRPCVSCLCCCCYYYGRNTTGEYGSWTQHSNCKPLQNPCECPSYLVCNLSKHIIFVWAHTHRTSCPD